MLRRSKIWFPWFRLSIFFISIVFIGTTFLFCVYPNTEITQVGRQYDWERKEKKLKKRWGKKVEKVVDFWQGIWRQK